MKKRPGCVGCPSEFDPCLWCGSGDNPVDVIVIGGNPSGFSIGKKEAFFGPTGRTFDRLLQTIQGIPNTDYKSLKIYKTYGVLAGAVDIKTEHIKACRPNLQRELSALRGRNGREPVIVAIGINALKALGIKETKITKVMGHVLTITHPSPTTMSGTRTLNVIPVFEMTTVNKQPGFTNVVTSAILHAVKLTLGVVTARETSLDVLTEQYEFPQTLPEVESLVDRIIEYHDKDSNLGPNTWAVALDTETNTLYAGSHKKPKTLMVSVAWDDGKAATILLDHAETPYDPQEAWKHIRRLTSCQKPKCFHNWKFDRKFLEKVSNCPVNRVVWDTLLGEHFIDEDKKGLYGLKKLTAVYAPNYTGYDDELQELLRANDGDDPNLLVFTTKQIAETTAAPPGRDQRLWDELRTCIASRIAEMAKEKENRDAELLKQLSAQTDSLYRLLDLKKTAKKKVKSKDKDGGFEDIPLSTIQRYAAIDADVTRLIMKKQLQRVNNASIQDEGMSVMRYLYLPGSKALGDMEMTGFCVDYEHLNHLDKEIGTLLVQTETELRRKFDNTANFRSNQQLMKLMNDMRFGAIPGADPGSSKKETMERYASYYKDGDPRKEFAQLMLEYRGYDKAKNTFLRNIRKLSVRDGKIHCSFNLNGTATGRISSSGPNMQNIPHYMCRFKRKNDAGEVVSSVPGFNIKKLFIPSSSDKCIINVDIKGAELRVYTAYSHDEKMIKVLNDGRDVHSFTASEIYKVDYDYLNTNRYHDKDLKKKRDRAKRVVFGTFYGAGPNKIAEQIDGTREEAREIINLLFREFPALRKYIDDTQRTIRTQQFVKTHFGRYRRFRLAMASKEHFAEACREAVNFLIQSTASDLVLSQLCEVSDHLPELDATMLGTVHDSMTFEAPKSLVNIEERVDVRPDGSEHKYLVETNGDIHRFMDKWIVDRVREKFSWLPVPFLYDVEIGPSYGETKEVQRGVK